MKTKQDIIAFIEKQPQMISVLKLVSNVQQQDCWVAAGFLRNAIWDHLHGYEIKPHLNSDVDVIYFEEKNLSPSEEQKIEKELKQRTPDIPWSVRNQARMHLVNEDPEYTSLSDALMNWPETATALAARYSKNQTQLLAPFGVIDLLSLTVRCPSNLPKKLEIYEKRRLFKNWHSKWPKLKFEI